MLDERCGRQGPRNEPHELSVDVTHRAIEWKWCVRQMAVIVLSVAFVPVVHGQEGPAPDDATSLAADGARDDRRFSLGLSPDVLESREGTSRPAFPLGVVDLSIAKTEELVGHEESPLQLFLSTETDDGGPAPPGFGGDFYEKLAQQRWPDGVTRMEKGLAAVQARMLEEGLVGYYGDDPSVLRSIDLAALGRLAVQWWGSLRTKRLPPGALIPRDAELALVVREADGSRTRDRCTSDACRKPARTHQRCSAHPGMDR